MEGQEEETANSLGAVEAVGLERHPPAACGRARHAVLLSIGRRSAAHRAIEQLSREKGKRETGNGRYLQDLLRRPKFAQGYASVPPVHSY